MPNVFEIDKTKDLDAFEYMKLFMDGSRTEMCFLIKFC